MSNKVQVTATVDDRDMLQAWQRQLRLLDKMERKLGSVGRGGKKGGEETKSGFKAAFDQAHKFAGAIGIVSSGLQVASLVANTLRAEIENIRSRQLTAGEKQITAARSQREALFNLGPERANELNNVVSNIATDTGAKQADLFRTASVALSFKGRDLTDADAYDAVRQAARLNPFDQIEQTAIAQGILAQQKKTGGTAQEVAGFQLAVKRASPVSSSAEFSENIAPGIADLSAFGNTPQQSGAILSTLGQGIGDPTGRVTRNAAINFAKTLEVLLPGVKGGTLERLETVNKSPELRQRLLGTLDNNLKKEIDESGTGESGELTGEAKAFATLIALLQEGNNNTKTLLQKTLRDIPNLSDGDELLNREIKLVDAVELQKTARLYDQGESAKEAIQLNDSGGRTGIIRQQIEEIGKATGETSTSQKISRLLFDAKGGLNNDGVDQAINTLEGMEQRQRGQKGGEIDGIDVKKTLLFPMLPPAMSRTKKREATDEEIANAEVIKNLIEQMKSLTSETKTNTEEVKKNTKTTGENTTATARPKPTSPPTAKLSR